MTIPFKDTFIPFLGVVEDVVDPLKQGRVQVRCYGYHTSNKAYIPTEYLQWFQNLVSNSAGVSGKGRSPTGLVNGSTVFGYFLDKTLQSGLIVGAISGTPTHPSYIDLGFNDPSGRYPEYIAESDVNRLARENGSEHWLYAIKESNRLKNIQGPLRGGEWSEPEYENNAIYPKNDVYETESGHIKEFDDTPGSERIHEYHKAGTYYEVRPDGSKVTKVVGDNYDIVAGDDFVYVRGSVNLTIDADVRTYIKGNMVTQIDGNKTEVVLGTVTEIYQDQAIEVKGSQTTNAGDVVSNSNSYENNSGSIKLNEG